MLELFIFLFVYIIGLIWLGSIYVENDIEPTLWSILAFVMPIGNLLLAIYLTANNYKRISVRLLRNFIEFKESIKNIRSQNKNKHEI